MILEYESQEMNVGTVNCFADLGLWEKELFKLNIKKFEGNSMTLQNVVSQYQSIMLMMTNYNTGNPQMKFYKDLYE